MLTIPGITEINVNDGNTQGQNKQNECIYNQPYLKHKNQTLLKLLVLSSVLKNEKYLKHFRY